MTITPDLADMMPEARLHPGSELRGFLPGDEDAWIDLLNTGEFGIPWDRQRFDDFITGPERACGSRVAVTDGRIAAATFASIEGAAPGMGRVDFVVSHPDVRGLGLGRAVCTAVVQYLVGRGYDSVILYTDDWRLPAISLYLSMGFEPRMTREDMPARWSLVMQMLEVGTSNNST